MAGNLPHLTSRNGTLYFRRRVPPRHQAAVGAVEWKKALGRASAADRRIRLELRLLSEATDEALALLERRQPVSRSLLEDALAGVYGAVETQRRWTLDEAAAAHAAERGLASIGKPERIAIDQFIAAGGKTQIDEITRSDVRLWLSWLRSERGQSPATVRRRLGAVRAVVSFALDQMEQAPPNAFARHRLALAQEGHRNPFTLAQLKLIDDWTTPRLPGGSTVAILRLLRGTGARPLEIGGLDASDLVLDGDVPVIQVRANMHRGLKTAGSHRAIPLLGDALSAARELQGCGKAGALFSEACHETGALSARLNKALRSAGIPKGNGLSAYSFRHTLQEGLRLTDAPFDVQQAILGHAPRSMTDRYGSRRVSLARMAAAIEKAHGWMARFATADD